MTQASPQQVLQQHWGYDSFRSMQEDAINAALAGQDCLVVLPTGGGKSLCYQVPAASSKRMTLVISPLIALMDDQVQAANEVGLRSAAIHSMMPAEQKRENTRAAGAGELDLLYVSPERLCVGDIVPMLAPHLGLFAIDEAHCVSHWGHDFRPEYRQLLSQLEQAPDVPRMALTATATQSVQEDIVSQLQLRNCKRLVGHVDRSNLIFRCFRRNNGLKQITDVIKKHSGEGGIIYAQTRKEVERIAEALQDLNIDCAPYHAGLPDHERQQTQEAFVKEQLDVVVATIAFGMGIDRSNVRFVIHHNIPKSIEHYQQEAGRAGRDGLEAECVLLHSAGDFHTHRFLMDRSNDQDPELRRSFEQHLREIGQYAVAPICRHQLIANHFDQSWPPPDYDRAADNCGACDVCLGETHKIDEAEAILLAQKIISGVWRCENRFGGTHVIQVLLGKRNDKVLQNGHQNLSVFGLLSEHREAVLRAWLDQLIVQDFISSVERNGFPILQVSEKGRALCKGEGHVHLSTAHVAGSKSKNAAPRKEDPSDWEGVDRSLFELYRELRKQIAEDIGKPPYIVFSDASLRDMARMQPTDEEEFQLVNGVGKKKLKEYGQAFIHLTLNADVEKAYKVYAG